jgi:DNA-binding winged helix-turn-helix (wHTH) protein
VVTSVKNTGQQKKTGSFYPVYLFVAKNRIQILAALFAICTLIYYWGQLADFLNWQDAAPGYFNQIHDTHRLFFLIPILFASYFFGVKTGLLVTVVSLAVFLPRSIFISPYPNAISRALIFDIFAGALSFLLGAGIEMIRQQAWSETTKIVQNGPSATERNEDEVLMIGELEANLSRRVIKQRGKIIKLTPKEYELLSYLIRNAGKALGHAELLRNIWGMGYGRESEYLRTFIWQLRHKLEDDPANPRYILTEPGVGYRFMAPEQQYQ